MAVLAAVTVACGGEDAEVRGASIEQPVQAPVTVAGEEEAVRPGDVVAAHPLGAEVVPAGAIGWEVVYRSTDAHGAPSTVTGVVYAPDEPPEDGGRPVLTWGHGPVGMADRCAPTRGGGDVVVPHADALIQAGFVVVATNYEGLGTPGPHPFLVGTSTGRSMLDIVRAAQRLEVAGASSRVVAGGHFSGGQAALFAGMLADAYAPELELLGIVAGAPATGTEVVVPAMAAEPHLFGYFAMVVSAYAETYDDLALDDLLSEDAIEHLAVLDEGCAPEIVGEYLGSAADDLLVRDPLASPAWAARIAENAVVPEAIPAPLLLLHGLDDDVLPIERTDELVAGLCGADRILQYRRARGAGHDDLYEREEVLVLGWIDARLNREPATSTCPGS